MADNVATVRAIYEAFGRGDVAWILDQLAEHVEWEQGVRDTGISYLRPRCGREQVVAFFGDLRADLELTHFEPQAVCDGGDVVAVTVVHAGRVPRGGEIPLTEEVHLWRFGPDGKVVSLRHHFDLAIHERALAERSRRHEGARFRVVADTVDVKRAGGAFELFEVSGPRDSGPPPHAHPWDEGYIGIAGDVEVHVGDTTTVVGPGDVVTAPGGSLHAYRILSDEARFNVVTSGHRASAFFADLDANVAPGMPTPDSLPQLIAVAQRHGLTSPLFA